MSGDLVTRLRNCLVLLFGLGVACGQTGTQTNWLHVCEMDAECGGDLRCLCGTCTRACEVGSSTCSGLPESSCIAASDPGVVALCGGSSPANAGLCLARCGDGCPSGSACVAGVCAPLHEANDVVTVNVSVHHQTLVGFGAGTVWTTDEIAQHPAGAALYDAMFADSGLDAIRLFNRYNDFGTSDLTTSQAIMSAATERLGAPPILLLTSTSPPAQLKANGSEVCSANPDTCTLVQLADGSFDYAGFASHWRAVVDAYAAAAIPPNYISIQNDPDWVPPASSQTDACRFLPTEGTATVDVNGTSVDVRYPGYSEALTAVVDAMADLPTAPQITAPDAVAADSAASFTAQLDLAHVDAITSHLLASDPSASDSDTLFRLSDLGRSSGLPIFVTEGQAEGLGTAVFLHEALTTLGATLYLQNDFVVSATLGIPNPTALIALGDTNFTLQDPYFALRHFAHDTDPGWVRIDASSAQGSVLATAFTSPDAQAVTVVLVNPDAADVAVELALGDASFAASKVTRTAFAGDERSAELGALPPNHVVTVVGNGIATVALTK